MRPGQGLATAAVRAVIEVARTEYGLTALTAGASNHNGASQAVLTRIGFRAGRRARSTDLGPGTKYELSLGGPVEPGR